MDVTTTITINGDAGARFLASLSGYRAPVPRALRWLAQNDFRSIEVDRRDADAVAAFVGEVLASGWVAVEEPPLLFSPYVGDQVRVCADVLAEVGRTAPGLPPSWRFVPAGTTGRMLGWRGEDRAIIDIDGMEKRLVVFVRTDKVTRARVPGVTHRAA